MYTHYVAPVVPFLSLVVTIIGWYKVSQGNDRREHRKEIRAAINEIRALVLDIQTRAFDYFQLTAAASSNAGTLLKQQLQHLAGCASSLAHQNPKFDVNESMLKLRQTITGGDFESFMREPRKPSDPLMNEIPLAAQQLLDDFERIFAAEYPGKK